MLKLPTEIMEVLEALTHSGYEAYVVGGCVRDSLLGDSPKDWDVTTSALPEETCRVFEHKPVIKTGIRHGTVTVLMGLTPVEVTTYRVDGVYSDHRRPDEVSFTSNLKEDLARRDFTINAMAYHPEKGLVDCFGGQKDCKNRVLRCVGQPEKRFEEDALRILRALRFASVLGFSVEPWTKDSLVRKRELLKKVAQERISAEFGKILCGRCASEILREYPSVFGVFLPELLPMVGFEQHNPHHCYDIWEHTLHSLQNVAPVRHLRLTMLLHDIAKPLCFSQGEDGVGHFYGHASKGEEIAHRILTRLRMDSNTIQRVCTLVKYHDMQLEHSLKSVKRWMRRLTPEGLEEFLQVKAADNLAQHPSLAGRVKKLEELRAMMQQVLVEEQCFSLKDLAVNGHDLIELGLSPGKHLGEQLEQLLNAVVDEILPNEKQALLQAVIKNREEPI